MTEEHCHHADIRTWNVFCDSLEVRFGGLCPFDSTVRRGISHVQECPQIKLEVVTLKVKEWDNPHQRDRHAAPSIVHDLEGLLELPQEGDEE